MLAAWGNEGTSKAELTALDGSWKGNRALAQGGLAAGELFNGAEIFRVLPKKLIRSAGHSRALRVGSWRPERAAPGRTAPQQHCHWKQGQPLFCCKQPLRAPSRSPSCKASLPNRSPARKAVRRTSTRRLGQGTAAASHAGGRWEESPESGWR